MRIPMELSKNLDYEHESDSPRYFLKIDIDEIAPGRKATIPIRWRANKSHPMLKEIYYADVGGFRIEKGNLQMLKTSIQEAVESLVDHRTLPYYSITLPNLTRIPVFLIGKHLKLEDAEIRVSGEDIGEVCRKLAKELVQKKETKGVDDLKVSIFLWADLKLYPPAFIIRDPKQRAWVPIFCHNAGGSLGLNFDIINMPSKIFKVEELSSIRGEVVSYLSSRKSNASFSSLFIDQVRDEVWKELRKSILKEDSVLRFDVSGHRREIALYKIGSDHLAADKPRIYFGQDREQLKNNVAEVLKEERLVDSTTSVSIERRRIS